MNKAEFLERLDSRIAVLTESERKDILDEYAQHIDMKMAENLSEQEAIEEFGDMDDLAADILEAYHVRADFGRQEEPERKRMAGQKLSLWLAKGKAAIKGAAGAAGRGCRKLWACFAGFFSWIGRGCKKAALHLAHLGRTVFSRKDRAGEDGQKTPKESPEGNREQRSLADRPDRRRDGREGETYDTQEEEKAMRKSASVWESLKKGWRACVGGCARFLHFCWNVCVWCAVTAINCACVCAGLLMCGFFCVALFCLGTLAVLLLQGYPLCGVTLGFLGLVLCLGTPAVFCFTLRIKRKTEALSSQTEPNSVSKRRRLWLVLTGLFAVGVLLGGIGTGIAFGEYTSLEYTGQILVGEMETKTLDFSYTPEEGKKLMLAYCDGGDRDRATLVEQDSTVPQDVIRYQVTYNRETIQPYLYYAQAENGEEGLTGVLYLRRNDSGDDFGLFMKYKDRMLSLLREKKLAEYRTAGVTDIRVLVHPSMMEYLEDRTR